MTAHVATRIISYMDSESRRREATELLRSMGERGERSDPRLDPLIYEEVRRLAHHLMKNERPSHTLQPTALAHEAYARLIDNDQVKPQDRGHFMALAARAMRRILVDHSRARASAKRGGAWQRVELSGLNKEVGTGENPDVDLLALDNALSELARMDEAQALVVELRFFAGMSISAIAEALDISESTVRRTWYVARAWLLTQLAL